MQKVKIGKFAGFHSNHKYLVNEISFELQMETMSMFMIFTVMLCYLSSSKRKPRTGLDPLSFFNIIAPIELNC